MLRQNHMARAISCGHIFAVEQGLMLVISGWIHLGKAPGIPSEKPTSCRLLDRIALKGHHGRNPQKYLELHMAPISCSTPNLQVGQLLSGPQNLEISGWNPPRWGGKFETTNEIGTYSAKAKYGKMEKKNSEILPTSREAWGTVAPNGSPVGLYWSPLDSVALITFAFWFKSK